MRRLILVLAILAGCGGPGAVDSERAISTVSCGGRGFPLRLLDSPGDAEQGADPAAAALRAHLTDPAMAIETDFLPRDGWIEVHRDDRSVMFVAWLEPAPGGPRSLAQVDVAREGDAWRVTGWGGCALEADVGPGLSTATFRVAPGAVLDPETTEVDVLVTERDCNSGEDARGRIVDPAIIEGPDTVTVVFAVRPRGGMQTCPSNPETPYRLVLPSPLGDRTLLDGGLLPARDATTCPDAGACP